MFSRLSLNVDCGHGMGLWAWNSVDGDVPIA